MAEPSSVTIDGAMLGIKIASVIAGFAGGVVSLTYLKDLSNNQKTLAVITGAVSAGYLTPIVVQLLSKIVPETIFVIPEESVAFIVGLTAMNIIPGLIKLSNKFKNDPELLLKESKK